MENWWAYQDLNLGPADYRSANYEQRLCASAWEVLGGLPKAHAAKLSSASKQTDFHGPAGDAPDGPMTAAMLRPGV